MIRPLAVSMLIAAAIATGPVLAETPQQPRLLSLSGHGEVKAVPNLAVIDLGTLSQAATARAALDTNTKNMTALLTMLKASGIDDKDVMTSNFSVGPRYDYGSNNAQPPKVVGYDVSNKVTVTVHKIADLGGILDKAVSAGSNQIDGISFTVADPQAQQDEARKTAVKDALRKADILSQAAGANLGPIITITESGGGMPVPTPMVMKAARGMAMDAPVPMAQGQMTISSDVNIVWQLQ